MKTTITEALAELKLIEKKISSKEEIIYSNLVRYDHEPDQFKSDGGVVKYIEKEVQALSDLRKRFVAIRSAIAKANIETEVTINNVNKTIYEWLNWKREISVKELAFNKNVYSKAKSQMDSAATRPQAYVDAAGNHAFIKLACNISYGDFLKKAEDISDTLEKLDGILSLKNATILIEV